MSLAKSQTIENFISDNNIYNDIGGNMAKKKEKELPDFEGESREIVEYMSEHDKTVEKILDSYKGKKVTSEQLDKIADELHEAASNHLIEEYIGVKDPNIDRKKLKNLAHMYIPTKQDIKEHFKAYKTFNRNARSAYHDVHNKHLTQQLNQPVLAKFHEIGEDIDAGKKLAKEWYKKINYSDKEIDHVLKDAKTIDKLMRAFGAAYMEHQEKLKREQITTGEPKEEYQYKKAA